MKIYRKPTNVVCLTAALLGVLNVPVPCLVSGHCARFEFPDEVPDTNQLEVPAGSNITIQFKLNLRECPQETVNAASMITIAKQETKRAPYITNDICKMKLQQGRCTVSFQPSCVCPDEEGLYTVLTTVSSSSQGVWIWRLTLPHSESLDREIHIKINNAIEPLNITGLTLSPPYRVRSGSSVDILCSFKGGRRSEKPVLRISGNLLAKAGNRSETGEWRHVLNNVSCEDSGRVISCHPPGLLLGGMSAVLDVACPPEFIIRSGQIDLDPRKATRLEFRLRLFDLAIPNCTISILLEDGGGQTFNGTAGTTLRSQACSGFFSKVQLSGVVPNRLLTLSSPKFVTLHDLGQWNLTLTNDAGSDTVTFTLRHLNESQSTDSLNPQTTTTGIIIITVVITLVVVAIIVSVIIVVLVVRKARKTSRRPNVGHVVRATSRAIHSVHIYDGLGTGLSNLKSKFRKSRGRDSQGENNHYEMPGNLYEIPEGVAPPPPPPLPLKPSGGKTAAGGDPLSPPPLPSAAATATAAATTTATTRASIEFPPPPPLPEPLLVLPREGLSQQPHPPPSPQPSISSTLSRGSRRRLLPSDHERVSGAASGSGSGSGSGSAARPKSRGPFRLQLPSFGAKGKNVQGPTSHC